MNVCLQIRNGSVSAILHFDDGSIGTLVALPQVSTLFLKGWIWIPSMYAPFPFLCYYCHCLCHFVLYSSSPCLTCISKNVLSCSIEAVSCSILLPNCNATMHPYTLPTSLNRPTCIIFLYVDYHRFRSLSVYMQCMYLRFVTYRTGSRFQQHHALYTSSILLCECFHFIHIILIPKSNSTLQVRPSVCFVS